MWLVCLLLCTLLPASAPWASTLTRDADPVVLEGSDLPWLLGASVDRVVAFRYESGWVQIPVQIDERDLVDFYEVRNDPPRGYTTLAYSDPETYVGPDSNPNFDANDELVFMVMDAGESAPMDVEPPEGALGGTGVEITMVDLLDAGSGHVYLFESDGSLDPSAGASYGSYTFELLSGSYIPNYNTGNGLNPENSSFVSSSYATHFSDRWIRDSVSITAGTASGVDILDRHKNMFGPGACGRTEETFSEGAGAFFANKNGPVRSIRSYMGANSGPLTQRDHLFYRDRQDVLTYLRVHAIAGIMDIYDYTPAATGMSYVNDLNTSGVTVDGSPDSVVTGAIQWEMVTGEQGTLIHLGSVATDIPGFAYTSYYSDNATPSVTQCTGDAFEYATSGTWIDQGIPNTDPQAATFNYLTGLRIVYYLPPNQSVMAAELLRDRLAAPLQIAAGEFPDENPIPLLPLPGLIGLAVLLLLGVQRGAR
jgi:hypothetical protein